MLRRYSPPLRKVRCDGARGRCSNCSRSKRSCSYTLVPEEDNKATKERKERLSALNSLGIVVPRGGAAVRATKDSTLQSFPPPPPSKEVKFRREVRFASASAPLPVAAVTT
jgi:hypothetical protein